MKGSLFIKFMRYKQIVDGRKRLKELGTDYGCEKIYDLDYMGDANENHLCDVYFPQGTAEKKLPVIMEIHGGGFMTGTKLINEGHGLYYASRGYKVVNVNYTVHPEKNFVEEMQELFSALHWIEANAEKHAFDLDKLFITGDSAGGFHVLLIAAIQNSPELQRYYNIRPVAKGIRGVAASCPCADVRMMMNSEDKIWKMITKYAFQSEVYQSEDYIHHVSAPDTFMMSEYPKVFMLTTPTDSLVYGHTLRVHNILNELGIDHVYKEYTGKSHQIDHVFNVLYPQYEESIEANEDILAYFLSMTESQ